MILRFASFNVLAAAHLRRGTYDTAALKLLRSDDRITSLAHMISCLWADVIGLQEAEEPLVEALHATGLWHVLWTPKVGQNKRDGCALLVRRGMPAHLFTSRAYADGSGHVMQQAKFGDDFTVVNTHIKWAAEDVEPHAGVVQTTELIAHLKTAATPVVILLGDVNGRPGGRVRTALDEAGFPNVWGEVPTARIIKDGHEELAPIDVIAVRGAEARRFGELPDVTSVPNAHCLSDHVPLLVDVNVN